MRIHAALAASAIGLVASAAPPSVAPESPVHRPVAITAEDARSHGLPPVGLRLDLGGTAMMETRFPEAGRYLVMSGPPGGPLAAAIDAWTDAARDTAALERAVRARFADPLLKIDGQATLPVAGARLPALAFFTGQSLARTGWLAAVVPAKGGGAVLLCVGVGHHESVPHVDAGAVIAHRDIAPILATLALE